MRANEFIIAELTGVKKYHNLNADNLIRQLSADTGLNLLGRGMYGYVLESKDPNWAYKFFRPDQAYLSYLKFIENNPSPHYPRIKQAPKMMRAFHKRYSVEADYYYVVLVERLLPIKGYDEDFDFFSELAYNDMNHVPRTYPPPESKQENEGDYTFAQMAESLPWIKSMHTALHNISRALPNFSLDLNSGNIMQRKDGTYVIIDPIADEWQAQQQYRDIMNAATKEKPQGGPKYKQ